MTRLEDALHEALDSDVATPTGRVLDDVRHGARRRRARRNAAVAVTAASVLVAGIVLGGSLLGGNQTVPDPAPAPTRSDSSDAPSTFPPPAPDVPTTISDDFPLAAGLETRAEPGMPGRDGPNRTLPPLSFEACGETAPGPPPADRLRASFTNVEYLDTRQLTTYADTEAAVAAVEQVVELYQACPSETDPVDESQGRTHEVRRTSVGREWWTIVTSSTMFGSPAAGLTITHVIQVGVAVLVLQESSEAGAGADRETDVARRLDRMAARAEEPISALCRFTAAGC
jgi:hypothetical protein